MIKPFVTGVCFLLLFSSSVAYPESAGYFTRGHYQLQNLGNFVTSHAAKENTLFVTDYSKDGTDENAFSFSEIGRLKNGGKNVVLSYLSVGEAESYRWYFSKLPSSVRGPVNPDWAGNYPVKYWDPRWQEIIAGERDSSLSRILDAGFDGVYLDVVDVFYRFADGRPSAAAEMVQFIAKIAEAGRRRNPRFLVFIQNASCMPERENYLQNSQSSYDDLMELFWRSINGIGMESTFFYGSKTEDNAYNPQDEVLRCSEFFRAHGKLLFAVDYVRATGSAARAVAEYEKHGMLGLTTDRLLSAKFVNYSRHFVPGFEGQAPDPTDPPVVTPAPTPVPTPIILPTPTPKPVPPAKPKRKPWFRRLWN